MLCWHNQRTQMAAACRRQVQVLQGPSLSENGSTFSRLSEIFDVLGDVGWQVIFATTISIRISYYRRA